MFIPEEERGEEEACLHTQRAALLSRSPCLSPVSATETPPAPRHLHLTLLPSPGPWGPLPLGEGWALLKDVTPGEDSEDELRLLAGLRRAGHDEVRAWLQPQLPTHFLLCEKLLRPIQGSIFPEEFRGQPPLVVIALGEGVGRGQQLSGSRRACGQAWAPWPGAGTKGASDLPNPTWPNGA